MRRRRWWIFGGIALLTGFAAFALTPFGGERLGRDDFVFGLDLKGGVYVELEAELPPEASGIEAKAYIDSAIHKIQNRVDALGVTEPVIQSKEAGGKHLIVVQLPGITDTDEAMAVIKQAAFLDFRAPRLERDGHAALDEEGRLQWLSREEMRQRGESLTGDNLNRAAATFTDMGEPQVSLDLDREGRRILEALSTRLVNSWRPTYIKGMEGFTDEEFREHLGGPRVLEYPPLGIFLDDRLISAPVFSHGPITAAAGGAVIENVTAAEATRYAIQLNSGALPVPLKETGDRRDIDPALGPQFIKQSLIAGAIGLGLVILFMFLFYRLLGLLAGGALLIYGCLVLSIFKLIPVTLTLAGLGGFILSIGMAVDANVLIFERLKEELRAGRTLGAAVEAGFARAWPAIRDSNVTTFIVCAILYWLGNWTTSPPVQGFALTLFIGVATSMFTAVFVTRNFLHLATGWRWLQRRWLYVWLREGRGV